jgi:hypothetical protein
MVLSNDGKQLNDIGLEGKPWGIVVVPDKEEAGVTLPDGFPSLTTNSIL